METKILAAVVAAAVAFSIGAAVPAAATDDNQVVGIEQVLTEPNGTEIAYTVSKILPSADPVAYPVAGQLYEATVMARATRGTVVALAPFFNARTDSGANYPALAGVSSLSGAPLQEGATADGKVYFDVVGPVPNRIVYDNPPEGPLTWSQPIAGDPATRGSAGGSGSTGGAGGSQGVTGSTGPNDAAPSTSGGDIGGTAGGVEGGGGNLDSGGGSGAPSGDTGGNTGSGGGGSTGGIGGGGGSVGVGGGG